MNGDSSSVVSSRVDVTIGISFLLATLVLCGWDLVALSVEAGSGGDASWALLKYATQVLVAIPSTVGLAALLLAMASRRLERAPVPHRLRTGSVLLLASAPILVQIPPLFAGPAVSESAWRFPLMVVAALAVFAGICVVSSLASRLARRAASSRRPGIFAGLALVLGLAIVLGLRLTSQNVLPGLYIPFHRILTLLAIAVMAAGFFVALSISSKRKVGVGRILIVLSLASLAGWPIGSTLAGTAPLARQLLVEEGTFVGPFIGPIFMAENRVTGLLSDEGDEPGKSSARAPFARARFRGDQKRSVVLVTVDALRGDALMPESFIGKRAPGLNRIATSSLNFARAYSPGNYTPISLPFMVLGYDPPSGQAPPASNCLSAPFNTAGYRTEFFFTADGYASLEKTDLWPLASRGFFFQYYHPEYRNAEDVLAMVDRSLERADGPVFIWAHLSDVHHPYLLHGAKGSTSGDYEKNYEGQLAYLDSVVTPFLERLMKRDDDVIWALSSDHGEALGEHNNFYHGSSLYEEQVRIPLLMGGAGLERGRVEHPVSITHLGATMLKLAGADVGKAPVLPSGPPGDDDPVPDVHLVGKFRCGIVRGDFKLVADPQNGTLGLFDLREDPGEKDNLVESRADLARELLGEIRTGGCRHSTGGMERVLGP